MNAYNQAEVGSNQANFQRESHRIQTEPGDDPNNSTVIVDLIITKLKQLRVGVSRGQVIHAVITISSMSQEYKTQRHTIDP